MQIKGVLLNFWLVRSAISFISDILIKGGCHAIPIKNNNHLCWLCFHRIFLCGTRSFVSIYNLYAINMYTYVDTPSMRTRTLRCANCLCILFQNVHKLSKYPNWFIYFWFPLQMNLCKCAFDYYAATTKSAKLNKWTIKSNSRSV